MASSTTTLGSYAPASATAAASPAGSFTLVIPTEEPRFAGLTKQGKPSAVPTRCARARGSSAPMRATSQRHTGMPASRKTDFRSEEHTSELQSQSNLVCRLLLEKKKTKAQ